jgi:hypothetical protein
MLLGQQRRALRDALLEAFPTPPDLEMMVRLALNRNLYAIVPAQALNYMAFRLIETAEAQGWTGDLIVGAREANPGNPALLDVSQTLGLTSLPVSRPQLEKVVSKASRFFDPTVWRERLWRIETQVARIEIPAKRPTGTGFLVGPDVVMTNYHVVGTVIHGNRKPGEVVVRFDYKRLADGLTVRAGTEYALSRDDWLVDSSPPSPVDEEADPKSRLPDPEELDYALLRLSRPAGSEPVGKPERPDAPTRGWVDMRGNAFEFTEGLPVFIMQHPKGDPLQLAVDPVVEGVNQNRTRVRYRTNTKRGSSGSPCFNSDLELVALHHSGDPEYVAKYNAGIPTDTILALLAQRNFRNRVGAA